MEPMSSLTLTLGLTHPVEGIVKDARLMPTWKHHPPPYFFKKILQLEMTVKKTVPKGSVFRSGMLVKDERGNLQKKRPSWIYLKYLQKWKNEVQASPYIITESKGFRTRKYLESLQSGQWPHTWVTHRWPGPWAPQGAPTTDKSPWRSPITNPVPLWVRMLNWAFSYSWD